MRIRRTINVEPARHDVPTHSSRMATCRHRITDTPDFILYRYFETSFHIGCYAASHACALRDPTQDIEPA
jgi:hypothetical protein